MDTMRRDEHLPLHNSTTIYSTLKGLTVGTLIPPSIYIQDYENGHIPAWTIQEREESGDLIILTLIDLSTWRARAPLGDASYVACDLFILPTRTLLGRNYLHYAGCIHARHMLGDIRQHARQIAEHMTGKKRMGLVDEEVEINKRYIAKKKPLKQKELW